MRYAGPLGKGYQGDKAKAMDLQGAARVLVGQTLARLNAPPLNGRGYLTAAKRLADGSTLKCMINALGQAPIIRTWIDVPGAPAGDQEGASISLLYTVYSYARNAFIIYEISLHVRAGNIEYAPTNTVYAVDEGVLYEYGDVFNYKSEMANTVVGGPYWKSSTAYPGYEIVVSWFDNKVFCNGVLVHQHHEPIPIAAAAIDFTKRPQWLSTPFELGYVDNAIGNWVGSNYAAPGVVQFSKDCAYLAFFGFSNMLYNAYAVGYPPEVGERNGYLAYCKPREPDAGGRIEAHTNDYWVLPNLIVRTKEGDVDNWRKTEEYELLAGAGISFGSGDQIGAWRDVMTIKIVTQQSIEVINYNTRRTIETTATLTYLDEEHELCHWVDFTSSVPGDLGKHFERTGTLMYATCDRYFTLMRLYDWHTTVTDTVQDSVYEATPNFALWSRALSGTAPGVGPSTLDLSLPVVDPEHEDAVYGHPTIYGTDLIMRGVISWLFLIPELATWAVPPSPQMGAFRQGDPENGVSHFCIVPYGPHMIYTTDFYQQARLRSEAYYAGLITPAPVRFASDAIRVTT